MNATNTSNAAVSVDAIRAQMAAVTGAASHPSVDTQSNAMQATEAYVVKAKSFFKKAKSGPNAGIKRADLEWNFAGVTVESIAELNQVAVVRVVNGFIESFGRKLIAAASDDWEFSVSPVNCNFELAYADLIAERSSGRVLTKESLTKFGDTYAAVMIRSGEVQAKAANTVRGLVIDKFASIAGKADVIAAVQVRINQFIELASEEELEPLADVTDAILALLEEVSAPMEITAVDI